MSIVNDLILSGKIATKREIYYQNEGMFRNQSELDRALDRLARTLKVPRDELHIVGGSKGLFYGECIRFEGEGIATNNQPRNIPSNSKNVLVGDCKFALVVEKEAVFQTIVDDYLVLKEHLGPFAVITGKGYPCMATRALVAELGRSPTKIPIFALVDLDPYGLEIALQYRIGSSHLAQDEERLACPSIQYLGATFSDIDCYGRQDCHQEALSNAELERVKKVQAKAEELGWTELRSSAAKMRDMRVKTEIEAIPNNANFFTRNYLFEVITSRLH